MRRRPAKPLRDAAARIDPVASGGDGHIWPALARRLGVGAGLALRLVRLPGDTPAWNEGFCIVRVTFRRPLAAICIVRVPAVPARALPASGLDMGFGGNEPFLRMHRAPRTHSFRREGPSLCRYLPAEREKHP